MNSPFVYHARQSRLCRLRGAALAVLLISAQLVHAQTFDSGSTGADGALNLTTPGTIEFDPVALEIDTDGDYYALAWLLARLRAGEVDSAVKIERRDRDRERKTEDERATGRAGDKAKLRSVPSK